MPQCGCCGPGACAAFSLQGPHPQDLLPACRYVPAGGEHFETHLIQSSLLFLPNTAVQAENVSHFAIRTRISENSATPSILSKPYNALFADWCRAL